MSLPGWDVNGLLPAGKHTATTADLYERCVVGAQHREWRETLFGAFVTYVSVIRRLIPSASAWVDGGFVTQKLDPPHDIDIVIHPDDWGRLNTLGVEDETALFGALTLQDAIIGSPVLTYLPRIQPVCGALDAFLCFPGKEQTWLDTWSSVKAADGTIVPGAVKGFVEVTW